MNMFVWLDVKEWENEKLDNNEREERTQKIVCADIVIIIPVL